MVRLFRESSSWFFLSSISSFASHPNSCASLLFVETVYPPKKVYTFLSGSCSLAISICLCFFLFDSPLFRHILLFLALFLVTIQHCLLHSPKLFFAAHIFCAPSSNLCTFCLPLLLLLAPATGKTSPTNLLCPPCRSLPSYATDSDASSSGSVTSGDSSSPGETGSPYCGGSGAPASAGSSVLKPTMLHVWLATFERNKLQTYEVLFAGLPLANPLMATNLVA